MRVTWSHVALPDDLQRALYSSGKESHGVRTFGAVPAGRNARTSDGKNGSSAAVPPPGAAGLTHMILRSGDCLRGARRLTPASEVVRPNWLFAGGLPVKLE